MTFGKAMLLIVNPTAGRRRRGLVDEVTRRVRAEGWRVDVIETAGPGDARRLADQCDAATYAVLAVAGGDGTINEVVNGLAARAGPTPALGIVPLGTANVLAYELGLPFTAAAIARTLTGGREMPVQPGKATCAGSDARCFSLMAGAGFDARVVAGIAPALKRRWGRAAYLWRALVEAARYRPDRYLVEIDGVRHEAASVIVSRSRHYGGPYVLAPLADLGQPVLHVCLFERGGRCQALRFGWQLLRGRLPGTGGYRVVAGRRVVVSASGESGQGARQPVQLDGDDALALPVSIDIAPGTVRLLQPAQGFQL